MAVTTSKTADQPIFESVFNAVAHAFSCYVQKASRADQVARLNDKSDEELAKMGLRREDIPRYVFRDLLHI
ncbi:DUF1127 domain-containing protein [Albibacillus kandeliae]|uniref:DUF1127 domain-containing protein n=1 Tax=Albibacillus kandeliae TaxID=2174228 RepID=UPI000D6923AE|nr:DUF1127 domain-containing protein [Albibacillus kandeliae]